MEGFEPAMELSRGMGEGQRREGKSEARGGVRGGGCVMGWVTGLVRDGEEERSPGAREEEGAYLSLSSASHDEERRREGPRPLPSASLLDGFLRQMWQVPSSQTRRVKSGKSHTRQVHVSHWKYRAAASVSKGSCGKGH